MQVIWKSVSTDPMAGLQGKAAKDHEDDGKDQQRSKECLELPSEVESCNEISDILPT